MQIQHIRSISIRRLAHSTGLAALISIVAIGTALLGTRYTSTPVARIPDTHSARSTQLGVSRPAGVDVRTLPAGYTDYFLPESSDTAAKSVSMQLGIAHPAGVDPRALPTGFSDYFLPVSASSSVPGQSMRLGISRPAGVDVRTLPTGYTDYFLPND